MGDVVDLDSRRPHVVEQQECRSCGHKQMSVQIDNSASFEREFWECSACHAITAVDVNCLRAHPGDCKCQVCWFINNYKGPKP